MARKVFPKILGAASTSPATTSTLGIVKIDPAAADAANPIALGSNSPKLNPAPSGAGKIPVDTGSAYGTIDPGASGTVLTSTGTGSAPTFQAAPGLSGLTAPRIPYAASPTSIEDSAALKFDENNAQLQMLQGVQSVTTDLMLVVGGTPSGRRNSAMFARSSDGINWILSEDTPFTGAAAGFAQGVYGIATNGVRFVAVGNGPTNFGVAYSGARDGLNWTAVNIGFDFGCSVCWNGTKFIVVSYTGVCKSSTDGVTWSAESGPGGTLNDLLWDGSKFVGVGPGFFSTSPNTISWTSHSSPFSELVDDGFGNFTETGRGNCIAWNGSNMYVAGGWASGNTLASAPDGTTWTGRGIAIFSIDCLCVAWNGTRFVAGGRGASNTLAHSTNGTSWTGLGKTVFDVECSAITWNGTYFVAVGVSGDGQSIAYSADGLTWTKANAGFVFGALAANGGACNNRQPLLTPAITSLTGTSISVNEVRSEHDLVLNPDGDSIIIPIGKSLKLPMTTPQGGVAVLDRYSRMKAAPAWAGFRNKLINGNYGLDQRKVGGNHTTTGLTLDRWGLTVGSAATTVTRQVTALTSDIPSKYFLRAVVAASGTDPQLWQRMEGVDTLAGEYATWSFLMHTPNTGTPPFITAKLTQNFGTGGSPSSPVDTPIVSNFNLSQTWTLYTFTVRVPSISGKTLGTNGNDYLELNIVMDSGGLSNTYEFAEMQLEPGEVATAFDDRPAPVELSMAQRFFWKSFLQTTAVAQNAGLPGSFQGSATGTANANLTVMAQFPVEMRAAPTITFFNPSAAAATWFNSTASIAATAVNIGTRNASLQGNAAPTASRVYNVHITCEAEL